MNLQQVWNDPEPDRCSASSLCGRDRMTGDVSIGVIATWRSYPGVHTTTYQLHGAFVSSTGFMALSFHCYACGSLATACPDCVVTVRVDPQTGLPPDVELRGGKPASIEPVPGAVARSTKEPICDACASRAGWAESAAQRHQRQCLV